MVVRAGFVDLGINTVLPHRRVLIGEDIRYRVFTVFSLISAPTLISALPPYLKGDMSYKSRVYDGQTGVLSYIPTEQ